MPRKEGPPLEERMQRARELAELKATQKRELLKQLYSSALYRWARKSSIAFLWLVQIILIDWALPYRHQKDKITEGYFDAVGGEQAQQAAQVYRPTDVFVKTAQGRKFYINYPVESREIFVNDSIWVYKSFLLNDNKKILVLRLKEDFTITSSVTYDFLPLTGVFTGLALMFVFVKNIEVKAFAWITLICTAGYGLFLLGYLATIFR